MGEERTLKIRLQALASTRVYRWTAVLCPLTSGLCPGQAGSWALFVMGDCPPGQAPVGSLPPPDTWPRAGAPGLAWLPPRPSAGASLALVLFFFGLTPIDSH